MPPHWVASSRRSLMFCFACIICVFLLDLSWLYPFVDTLCAMYFFCLSGLFCFITISFNFAWPSFRSGCAIHAAPLHLRESPRNECLSSFLPFFHSSLLASEWNGMGMEWEWNRLGWINHKGDGWLAGRNGTGLVDACIQKESLVWLLSSSCNFLFYSFALSLSFPRDRSWTDWWWPICCETELPIYLSLTTI